MRRGQGTVSGTVGESDVHGHYGHYLHLHHAINKKTKKRRDDWTSGTILVCVWVSTGVHILPVIGNEFLILWGVRADWRHSPAVLL
jgi:hypothetical protein